jgi:methyl-accepting chemotaxis protein
MTVRNMNIGPRAALGFGLLALLVFALGIFALVQMSSMRKQSDHVETKWLPSVMELGTLGQDLMRVRTLTLRLMLNRSPEALRDNAGKLDQLKAGLKVTQQNYAALIGSPRERELYEAFAAVQAAYLQRQDKVMELSAAGQTDEALKMINGEMTQLADKMTVALNDLTTLNKQGALDASDLGCVFQCIRLGRRHDAADSVDYPVACLGPDPKHRQADRTGSGHRSSGGSRRSHRRHRRGGSR